jgi:hypothetical protein
LLTATLFLPTSAFAWGKQGHRVTGELAARNLTPAASQRVQEITRGLTLWQISVWADYVRSEPAWRLADTWHYMTVEDESTVQEVLGGACAKPPCGVAQAIDLLAAVLRGDAAQRQHFAALTEAAGVQHYNDSIDLSALALLVHFVGDIHQPLHVGRGDDRGGNQISANWFGEVRNLHSIWDSGLIDSEELSFTELTNGLENEFGSHPVEQGDTVLWAREAKALRSQVYRIWDRTSRDNNLPDLSYQYVHDMRPLVMLQLHRGGHRLAGLLNQIFGAP